MEGPRDTDRRPSLAGVLAALFWCVSCVLWFDDGAPWRPRSLDHLPSLAILVGVLPVLFWLFRRAPVFWGQSEAGRGVLFVVALSLLFRLPLAIWAACGYTTPDGALSGIVAVHIREGIAHHVFIPPIPYSGSLKSHLTAVLSYLVDFPRAFALSSIVFYGVFVAGVYRLARLADPALGMAAGLYIAFSPAFVTHYSLSNDGNYVEVLAFGTWALLFAARALREEHDRMTLALGAGLLLGLALWSHLLAVIYIASVFLVLAWAGGRKAPLVLAWFGLGGTLGFFPGLLWNVRHSWDSLLYVLPGVHTMRSVAAGPDLMSRARLMVTEQWPILMGYDPGYATLVDTGLFLLAVAAIVLAISGGARAAREAGRNPVWGVLLLYSAINITVATVSLPYVRENPRYVLFLMSSVPVFMALVGRGRLSRLVLAALVVTGATASLAQVGDKMAEDVRWRRFVGDLEMAGVRACYTDFYLAAKIVFLSEERVVCSSKLGPTTTEYFDYRSRVEAAPEAALIPVNETAAEKIARRLERLDVGYERREFMKPTFCNLSRKVDPQELFPDRAFPER